MLTFPFSLFSTNPSHPSRIENLRSSAVVDPLQRSSGASVLLPSPEEMIYTYALDLCREAAGEEVIIIYHVSYQKVLTMMITTIKIFLNSPHFIPPSLCEITTCVKCCTIKRSCCSACCCLTPMARFVTHQTKSTQYIFIIIIIFLIIRHRELIFFLQHHPFYLFIYLFLKKIQHNAGRANAQAVRIADSAPAGRSDEPGGARCPGQRGQDRVAKHHLPVLAEHAGAWRSAA